MEVRQARARDVVKHTRYFCPSDFVGYVVEDEGEFMGMGWVVWADDGKPYVFFEVADEARKFKAHIARWSLRFMKTVSRVLEEVYVLEDETEPGSKRWIEWLGFEDTGRMVKGHRVLKWQRQL